MRDFGPWGPLPTWPPPHPLTPGCLTSFPGINSLKMESKVHLMQPKVEPPSQFCLWSPEPPLYSQSSRISEPLPWQNCLCIHMQDLDFLSFSFIFNLTLLVFTWHYKSENSFDCYFSHLSNISKIGEIHKFGKLEHIFFQVIDEKYWTRTQFSIYVSETRLQVDLNSLTQPNSLVSSPASTTRFQWNFLRPRDHQLPV